MDDAVDARWVYVTTATTDEAKAIGRTLVAERLAACANVLGGLCSMYWWEDEVREDDEVGLVLKTRAELMPELIERIRAVHSYEVPCVVSLPIMEGNPDFLEWIAAETRGD